MRRTTVGLVAAVLFLAGCGPTTTAGSAGTETPAGSTGTVGKPANALGGAGEASRKAGTAKMATTMEATTGGQTETMGTGAGEVDFANSKYKFSQDMNGSGGMNTVLLDGVGYLQYNIGGNPGPWAKLDLAALLGKGSTDMTGYLNLLQGVSESNEVGSDTVRGVATTHYKIVIDPAKTIEKSPEMKQFLESLKKLGGSSADTESEPMPYDVWLDDQGLVRRMRSETKVAADGAEVVAVSTVEYYDYGTPVDITAPTVG